METNFDKRMWRMWVYSYEILLVLPTIEEQQKIADFFIAIDEQIDFEKEILKTMEKQKKGLLQGLFD